MKKMSRATGLKIVFLILILAIVFMVKPIQVIIGEIFEIFKTLDVGAVKAYILSFGIWAPVVSFLLMMFQSLVAPLPAFLITFANAGLFGWIMGAVLSWTSAMAGAVLCFYLSKFYGRGFVEKLTSKFALQRVDDFFDKYGKYAVLIARLLPFMSFDIVSYGAGLTSMRFWSFFWATGLGQLPATIIYSYVGGMLTGSVRMVVMGLLILFSVSILGFMLKRIFQEKKVSETK